MKLHYTIWLIIFISWHVANAQSDALTTITQEFKDGQDVELHEKIYVHTDRDNYLTGEVLWLKIYCLDAFTNIPLDASKVAYVELLDDQNKAVIQIKIKLFEGAGNGSFYLPASISSGNYVLRCYTHWMKNVDPEFYFHKQITVINTFQASEQLTNQKESMQLEYFPEGGSLVNGLLATVAFKINNNMAPGLSTHGVLLANGRDTIAKFNSNQRGLGKFDFIPKRENKYEVVFTSGNKITRLPYATTLNDQGYTMQLQENQPSNLSLVVHSTYPSGTPVYLVAHTRGEVIVAKMNLIENGKTQFLVSKEQLRKGLTHFTLFDSNRKAVCNRLYFNRPDPSSSQLHLNNELVGTRKKLVVQIDSSDLKAIRDINASISVHAIDSSDTESSFSIESYINLFSEVKGVDDFPDYNSALTEELDLFAMTHEGLNYGWDFSSNKRSDSTKYQYLPELHGPIVSGIIVNKSTSLPVANIISVLSVPGKVIHPYVSRSNRKGEIYFEMKDFFDAQRIYVECLSPLKDSLKIVINDPFESRYASHHIKKFELKQSMQNSLTDRSIYMQAQNIFQPSFKGKNIALQIDSTNFYGKADEDYKLDDYTRFKTMEEVLREYVPGIIVKKRKDNFSLWVLNAPKVRVFTNPPFLMVDGVLVTNADKIIAYDPLKIKRLEVITRPYYIGPLIADGLVSFTSYTGSFEGIDLDPQTLSLNYEGLQLQKEFFSPDYSSVAAIQSRLADFRDLLYWNPSVTADSQGKINLEFYSSDKIGKYKVDIQGIGRDGKPFTAHTYFRVQK